MSEDFKYFRRAVKSKMPYVRRRVYKKVELRLRALEEEMQRVTGSAAAQLYVAKEPVLNSEYVCYFVTYAKDAVLKPHVEHHIQSLVACGVSVMLIVNYAGERLSDFKISDHIYCRLSGALIRENLGFDFAAWSHAYCRYKPEKLLKRAFFVNDSIVGPLGDGYAVLLDHFKRSEIQMVGLTNNTAPKNHVQSFFWSLSAEAFFDEKVSRYIEGVVNFSNKQFVIDIYEIGLTQFLERLGFNWSVLFQNAARDQNTNQTIYEWELLLERGFPFVKASLFSDVNIRARLKRVVPLSYAPQ